MVFVFTTFVWSCINSAIFFFICFCFYFCLILWNLQIFMHLIYHTKCICIPLGFLQDSNIYMPIHGTSIIIPTVMGGKTLTKYVEKQSNSQIVNVQEVIVNIIYIHYLKNVNCIMKIVQCSICLQYSAVVHISIKFLSCFKIL